MGCDTGDEGKITATVSIGKNSDTASSSNTSIPCSNQNHLNEDKRVELFHIRITSKHTKIDRLFDSRSHENLISNDLVNKLALETHNHLRPYPLGWLNKETWINVTKQCRLKFSITNNYIDEVDLDVIPADICGVVLGSPYLYDRDVVFYRKEHK